MNTLNFASVESRQTSVMTASGKNHLTQHDIVYKFYTFRVA
ncbi:MAG: hypothetical protein OXD54_15785 [Candidatus Poribacteria bacterium]|nr:hypothetical protein [Candidatus Poribacteria bacterium]